LPISCGKRFAFHRFQRNFLGEQDVANDELALWREAQLSDGFATRVEFLDVHGRAIPDAVAHAGVGSDDTEMLMRIPQCGLFGAQPGTEKRNALFVCANMISTSASGNREPPQHSKAESHQPSGRRS
jgi:hypothetical protein